MEVLKTGKIPDPVYEATCRRCSTEIRFKHSESSYEQISTPWFDPRDASYRYVECPTCRSQVVESTWKKEVKDGESNS